MMLRYSHERTLVHALEPDAVRLAEQQATGLFSKVSTQRAMHGIEGSPWIFGTQPTALDAHVTVFVARLIDAGRQDLVLEDSFNATKQVVAMPEWQNVMKGRRTIYTVD